MENLGVMERYKFHWYSADGYYNAVGDAQDTLNKLIAQLPDLTKKLSDTTLILSKKQSAYDNAVAFRQQCQDARDQKTGGMAKNKACDIDELGARGRNIAIAKTDLDAAITIHNGANSALTKLNGDIDDATKKAKEASKTDPETIKALNKQAGDVQVAIQQAKEQSKVALRQSDISAVTSASASKNKKLMIVGAIVIGILTLGFVIIKKFKK